MKTAFSYTVIDAAAAVGISRSNMWKVIKDEGLNTFKLGGRTLILAGDLQAFVKRKYDQSVIS